eukprot:TRINITY_DN2214_c0_g1_i1.p1 TRINITY_DN2214_c0_g1~~TRINITY_DN2214_c0_g1_i1.p1  ORF type:complete len:381 (+),score=74.92 TRINITY_DN2214_c0_g1_i1:61-1203(+)
MLVFFFFKQKTAYEIMPSLVGSEMCIRDRYQRRVHGVQGDAINENYNFKNFHSGLIVLFKASTREDWLFIMHDISKTPPNCTPGVDCGSAFAIPFMLSYVTISSYIMLNLFVLIILNDFEEYNLKSDNSVEQFSNSLQAFNKCWNKFTKQYQGEKIHQKKLIQFFMALDPPLGFGSNKNTQKIIKEILKMQIHGDKNGFIYFNELLFVSMKRVMSKRIISKANKELLTYIAYEESQTKKKLLTLQKQMLSEEMSAANNSQQKLSKQRPMDRKVDKLNPFTLIIFVRMCLVTWKKFAKLHGQKICLQKQNCRKISSQVKMVESFKISEQSEEEGSQEQEKQENKHDTEKKEEEQKITKNQVQGDISQSFFNKSSINLMNNM